MPIAANLYSKRKTTQLMGFVALIALSVLAAEKLVIRLRARRRSARRFRHWQGTR